MWPGPIMPGPMDSMCFSIASMWPTILSHISTPVSQETDRAGGAVEGLRWLSSWSLQQLNNPFCRQRASLCAYPPIFRCADNLPAQSKRSTVSAYGTGGKRNRRFRGPTRASPVGCMASPCYVRDHVIRNGGVEPFGRAKKLKPALCKIGNGNQWADNLEMGP